MSSHETDARNEALETFAVPYQPGDSTRQLTSIATAVQHLTNHAVNPNTFLDLDAVTILARVILKRNAGKIVFATVRSVDRDGTPLQIFLNPQNINLDAVKAFKATVHIGDVLYVTGQLGYSSTGEQTLHVTEWEMASKALNSVPKASKNPDTGELEQVLNKHTQHETPVLHLMLSPNHRNRIVARATMIQNVRQVMMKQGYLEVDTPVLSTHAGGAAAAKFETQSNALDKNLYLRIAPELYLKRLVIGGLGNVFEIGKNFRNEGIDSTHSPEFTSLEAYTLNSDYSDQMRLTQDIINHVWGDQPNNPMDDVRTLDFFDSLNESLSDARLGSVSPDSNRSEVVEMLRTTGKEPSAVSTHELLEDLFDEFVVPRLTGAVFIVDFPTGTSPLAYPNGNGTSQKWDLYINNLEIATAYTENTNPLIQEETLLEDQDFVHDLKYGMPPLGGLGIGLDRLAMVLTGTEHINNVQHHPHSSV